MIAKISRGSSFYGAANYNQQKIDKGEAKVLAYKGLLNAKPLTIDTTLNSLNNSRTKKPVFHASLSFSHKDKAKLDDKKMVAITKDYLKQMGYDKQPHVIYRHHDTNHPHVHILTTRVDTQKGQRLPSYNEGIKSKAITEQLELKYQLTVANEQRNNLKTVIVKDVKQVLQNDKPESVIAMNQALSENGSDYRIKAVKSGGIYYKADDNDKRKPVRFKSSLGDFKAARVSFNHLEKAFEQNRVVRIKVKELVKQAIPEKGKISLSEFSRALQAQGMTTIVYKNDKSVYGIGYNYKGHTYNGKDLSAELSYDNIKSQLQIPSVKVLQIKDAFLERFQTGQKLPTNVKWNQSFKTGDSTLDKYLNELSNYRANKLVASFNEAIDVVKAPNIDFAKIQNQFEDRLSQLQIELEIGQQRQLSIGR